MRLSFRQQHRQKVKRRLLYSLSCLALLIAIGVLVAWLVVRYNISMADRPSESGTSSAPVVEESLADTGSTLLILNERNKERFVLVQASPARKEILAVPVTASLKADNGTTLAEVFQQQGSRKAVQTVSAALQLPVSHYITFSVADMVTFMNYLEGTLTFQLPESINYTDENGLPAQVKAGERQLNANQIAGVLRHETWKKPVTSESVFAQLIAAILNQNLLPELRFGNDFAVLCNTAQTDLRIDHFNAYAYTLHYLADSNSGSLCRTQALIGSTDAEGYFLPDVDKMRHKTPLYAN